ncbi:hypothetical protein BDA99DRAFT_565184 [Phascolomyces articulosus]|uniref:Uncharacterized protein n=1 Tax=Phascolomyces articulosus TaxID=60185 RepID=A0AAD5P8J7_9FUNG|nr:hypothetical protein BDA99DRAFT_565184 [Phascolomyces articulosus]
MKKDSAVNSSETVGNSSASVINNDVDYTFYEKLSNSALLPTNRSHLFKLGHYLDTINKILDSDEEDEELLNRASLLTMQQWSFDDPNQSNMLRYNVAHKHYKEFMKQFKDQTHEALIYLAKMKVEILETEYDCQVLKIIDVMEYLVRHLTSGTKVGEDESELDVIPKLECSLAILLYTKTQVKQLERAQNNCIRMIFGAHKNSETKVMRHLTNLPSIEERTNILQAKFLLRATLIPDDTHLSTLQPQLNTQPSTSQWIKLQQGTLWKLVEDNTEYPSNCDTKTISKQYRADNLTTTIEATTGWLPGGRTKTCKSCNTSTLTKKHAIQCLRMHRRLHIPHHKTDDPISFFLNKLPKSKPTSSSKIQQIQHKWPTVCRILAELDYLQHPESNQQQCIDPDPGQAQIKWIEPLPSPGID